MFRFATRKLMNFQKWQWIAFLHYGWRNAPCFGMFGAETSEGLDPRGGYAEGGSPDRQSAETVAEHHFMGPTEPSGETPYGGPEDFFSAPGWSRDASSLLAPGLFPAEENSGVLKRAGETELYCKALLYASGAGRTARDWIAGFAMLATNDPSLLEICTQYEPAIQDVDKCFKYYEEALESSEYELLKNCFMYDAIKAATFGTAYSNDCRTRMQGVASRISLSDQFVEQVVAIVQEENMQWRDKLIALQEEL